jgi:hypothetical protein
MPSAEEIFPRAILGSHIIGSPGLSFAYWELFPRE